MLPLRLLGRTGLEVTPLGVGTSPLGNTGAYAYDVPLEDALATVRHAPDSPIEPVLRGRPQTEMGWEIDPDGL